MTDVPRVRDVYAEYRKGHIPFDEVIRASDAFLDAFQGRHGGQSSEPAVPLSEPTPGLP